MNKKQKSRFMKSLMKDTKILKSLEDPKYWKPSYTQLSKDHKVAVTSIYDMLKRHENRIVIDVKVKVLSDMELLDKWKK